MILSPAQYNSINITM